MKKLIASPPGLRKIKQARKEKGWNINDSRWLESASEILGVAKEEGKLASGISYGTWKRFLGGKHPINDRASCYFVIAQEQLTFYHKSIFLRFERRSCHATTIKVITVKGITKKSITVV